MTALETGENKILEEKLCLLVTYLLHVKWGSPLDNQARDDISKQNNLKNIQNDHLEAHLACSHALRLLFNFYLRVSLKCNVNIWHTYSSWLGIAVVPFFIIFLKRESQSEKQKKHFWTCKKDFWSDISQSMNIRNRSKHLTKMEFIPRWGLQKHQSESNAELALYFKHQLASRIQ